ncbi:MULTISPECIES: Gfo/Idh/MocA family protein [unclassified Microbacterium]|uniref:Gfo/Idh/MocA family protein n=1 Tax=unclassified Microbacterium TaxID=2609290 RepID=UPI001604ECE4|nr:MULTISPECIES: Gfo/Idh/MocA family oxidoreductase [unclassified Microbacterium]QNA93742.1 Gfo/Idh/MocA family oxidoreductase [Microbacterium sp. Se63.02b]QYM64034.1 Gfo/Idh/MocA family oxidoreductase [Microbacterium sp. Se5.02b]
MSVTRVAVIGLGAISQSVHLPLLRRNADTFAIAALVDLSAERTADMGRRYGVADAHRFTSVDDLVAAKTDGAVEVDAAILATTGSHAGDTLRLVRAGIRVLAEKPLAYSVAELDALTAYADEAGVDLRDWVRVGYMKEYDTASLRAKELLADVTLRAVSVQVMHPLDGSQLAYARLAAPTGDVPREALEPLLASTSSVVDGAVGSDLPADLRTLYTNVVLGSIVHDVGLLRSLVGGLGEVSSAQHWGPKMPGSVHLRGALARDETPWTVDWHYIDGYPDYQETVTFHHETGTIELVFGVPYVTNLPTILRVTESHPELGIRVSESRWMQQEAFENELYALAALVRGERPSGAGVEESVADVRVGQRMIRALALSKGFALAPGAEAAQ